MKVCVVGSGGREHALAEVVGRTAEVVVTPGNPGIPQSIDTDPIDVEADLFVIGPEVPLVDGLADRLRAAGRRVFGPGADGAQLEGSKAWMKEVLQEAGVPTARFASFGEGETEAARAFLRTLDGLYVIKTDGLAAGKGVLVTESLTDADDAVDAYLSGAAFGDAGRTLVIEEGLTGPELSVFALCDGRGARSLPSAQDFKRVGDGDVGPNTGGMGAFSPVPLATDDVVRTVMSDFVAPTLKVLRQRGIDYRGVLFAGLMMTPSGPKLLEYNCRFGDPETQVVLPRLTCDVAELLAEVADGRMITHPTVSDDAVVTVVCASEGYPIAPRTGDVIEGLEAARAVDGVSVFCAGVGRDGDGRLITAGGRVLNVTGRGATVDEARSRAYEAVNHVRWPGRYVREDIAANTGDTSS